MSIRIWLRIGLGKGLTFAQQVLMELGSKGLVSSFGEERLLLKNSQQAHWLLKHVNAFLQIHSKVNIGPVNALTNIFLLLKDKHVLVEELLQFLITEVDANLLKAIVVKDLKSSNIKAT